jgi:acyl-coenzyme A thioesterase PaaI-like protein
VTDLPPASSSVPARLGARFRLDGDVLGGVIDHVPVMSIHGGMPMASIVFLVDAVAGVTVDDDPEVWAFTSDLTVHLAGPVHAPLDATCTVLRNGRRSAVCEIVLTAVGEVRGIGNAAFAKVARRADDPPKPPFDVAATITRLRVPPIDEPVRVACGFEVGSAPGIVRSELRSDLLNPAGAMQGAIVGALAEAAAEDLAGASRMFGVDHHAVVAMEIRYLTQNRRAPITATAVAAGPASSGLVRVELTDGGGRRTGVVLTRLAPA